MIGIGSDRAIKRRLGMEGKKADIGLVCARCFMGRKGNGTRGQPGLSPPRGRGWE